MSETKVAIICVVALIVSVGAFFLLLATVDDPGREKGCCRPAAKARK